MKAMKVAKAKTAMKAMKAAKANTAMKVMKTAKAKGIVSQELMNMGNEDYESGLD